MFKEFHYQVRGRGHVRDGTPGQDRTAFLSRGGVQVLCLADGAGSASHSEHGAQALVDEGCRLLADQFQAFVSDDDGARIRQTIARHLVARLDGVAGRRGVDVKDLAATFMAVAASTERFFIVHIGDGVVGFVKDGEGRVASSPDNSEFANQTSFLTSEQAAYSMRLYRGSLDGVAGFVLMSDGTANSLYDSRANELAPACEKLIARVGSAPSRQSKNSEHKKQLRRLVDTKIRHATKDDCSIGILARAVGTATGVVSSRLENY